MLTLQDVKDFLKIEHDEEDIFLSSLIVSSDIYIKTATHKDADNTTELFKLAQNFLISHWYENRSLIGKGSELGFHLESILFQIANTTETLSQEGQLPSGDYAPLIHTHTLEQIDGLITELNNKQNVNPTLDRLSDDGSNLLFDGVVIASTSGGVDLSNYYTKPESDTKTNSIQTSLNGLTSRVDILEQKPEVTPYDDTVLNQRVTSLENNKQDKGISYSKSESDLKESTINNNINNLTTRVTTLENKPAPTPYDDTQIKSDISSLQTNKQDKGVSYTKVESDNLLNNKENKLNNRSTLDKLSDNGTQLLFNGSAIGSSGSGTTTNYDDTAITQRVTTLENDVSGMKNVDSNHETRITTLENKPDPAPYDDTSLKTRVSSLETSQNSQDSVISGKADKVHTHVISDITNLQTSLDNKSDKTHTHPEYVHSNLTVLNDLSDNGSGKLAYKGITVDTAGTGGGSSIDDTSINDFSTWSSKKIDDTKSDKYHTHTIDSLVYVNANNKAPKTILEWDGAGYQYIPTPKAVATSTNLANQPAGTTGDLIVDTTKPSLNMFGKSKDEYWESNGTSEYLKLPAATFTDLEFVASFEPSTTANQYLFDDAASYGSSAFYYNYSTGKFNCQTNITVTIDGVAYGATTANGRLLLTDYVVDNKKHTFKITLGAADNGTPTLFASNATTPAYFTKGKIYSVKLYNAGTAVSTYDWVVANGKWVARYSGSAMQIVGGIYGNTIGWGEISSTRPQIWSVYVTGGSTATSTTSITVPFSNVIDNSLGIFDTTTYKATILEDGLYEIHFKCLMTPTTAGEYKISANWAGSANGNEVIDQETPANTTARTRNALITRRFKAGDTFWITAQQTAGASNITVQRMTGKKIAP